MAGAILAGGQARRMGGGDKTLLPLAGCRLLDRVVARLAPQVDALMLSANGDPARFSAFGLPVVADDASGPGGPLAGILAALEWAARQVPAFDWVLTVPGDTPFLPGDLRVRLQAAAQAGPVCAASGVRAHWTVGLWPARLRAVLLAGSPSVGVFARNQACALVSWPNSPVDPFTNVNTPADLAAAERLAPLLPTRPACRPPG